MSALILPRVVSVGRYTEGRDEPHLGFPIPRLWAIRPRDVGSFFTTIFLLDLDLLTLRFLLFPPVPAALPFSPDDLLLLPFLRFTVLRRRLDGARGVRSRMYTAVLSPATTALIVSSSQVDCGIRKLGAICAVRAWVMRWRLTLARTLSLCWVRAMARVGPVVRGRERLVVGRALLRLSTSLSSSEPLEWRLLA